MSGTVSTRWFWSDWMSDPGLRACSYAARGLWKDMLCIAGSNKGKEYGFVTLNGKILEAAGIARMTNGTETEVATLLAELETNGVFSRDRRRAIYCRRMLRAEKNRSNGRLGGNPNLKNNRLKSDPVQSTPEPLLPEPKPEPEPKPKKKNPTPSAPASDWPKDYQIQFWTSYPRRTEKKAALAKLDAVKKSGVPWANFLEGVMRYAAHVSGTPEKYIKHPTTWLNKGCWDDELGPRSPDDDGGSSRPSSQGFAGLMIDMMERKH